MSAGSHDVAATRGAVRLMRPRLARLAGLGDIDQATALPSQLCLTESPESKDLEGSARFMRRHGSEQPLVISAGRRQGIDQESSIGDVRQEWRDPTV
jgi:hypothetical protein